MTPTELISRARELIERVDRDALMESRTLLPQLADALEKVEEQIAKIKHEFKMLQSGALMQTLDYEAKEAKKIDALEKYQKALELCKFQRNQYVFHYELLAHGVDEKSQPILEEYNKELDEILEGK